MNNQKQRLRSVWWHKRNEWRINLFFFSLFFFFSAQHFFSLLYYFWRHSLGDEKKETEISKLLEEASAGPKSDKIGSEPIKIVWRWLDNHREKFNPMRKLVFILSWGFSFFLNCCFFAPSSSSSFFPFLLLLYSVP